MRASRLGDEFGAFDAVMPSRTRRRGPAPRSHRAAWPVTTSVCTPPLGPLLAVANEDLPPLTASGVFCHGARTSGRSPCPGLGGRHRASPTRRARAASFILRLRLVTSQGSPYPSRSPRAHPSGWTIFLVSYRTLARCGFRANPRVLTRVTLRHRCARQRDAVQLEDAREHAVTKSATAVGHCWSM